VRLIGINKINQTMNTNFSSETGTSLAMLYKSMWEKATLEIEKEREEVRRLKLKVQHLEKQKCLSIGTT
jgi:hypothetical protein